MAKLIDSHGKTIGSPKKNATGLYGSIFSYGNAGKYKYRYYTLGDSNQGLDTYSRELLVRWSREMSAQNPTISSAINILSQFAVGDEYTPYYIGNNTEWAKIALQWLQEDWYPNCCTRGNSYDFKSVLFLLSQTIDTDGDLLQVFGQDKNGFPIFQIIPSHRIKSLGKDYQTVTEGKYKGCISSDGVIYTPQGKAIAYVVENAGNLVNSMAEQTPAITFDGRDARLWFDVKYFDKNRGAPTISAGILQAISLQELDQYEMDKLKMQSMIGLVEKNASGEAPQELQDTLQSLLDQGNNTTTGNPLMVSPNQHAVHIVQGPEIKYLRAEGGDLKSFASTGPTSDAQEYMTKLETQVLATLGVPHQLVFSTTKVGGRVTSATAEIFRAAITKKQVLIDKVAKFTVGWALSKAMEAGLIPENNEENMTRVFDFTRPKPFSLDTKYDADVILNKYNNGISSLNDATQCLTNKTSSEVLNEQKNEQLEFYKLAKEVSDKSGIDINTVIANWRQTSVKTTATIQIPIDEPQEEE